uniref:Uncharacterized protein n=1 Tax=Arundo donax TaxID=35708 RepID=A0A0A9GRS0_ARUDO
MFHLSRSCNYFLSYGSRLLMLCVRYGSNF